MSAEPLGIAAALKDRRESFAARHPSLARFFLGTGPRYDDVKATKIAVDCATGKRTVEKADPPRAETVNPFDRKIIPVDLRYRHMPSIAAIMGEQERIAKLILPSPTIPSRDLLYRPHKKLRPSYASAITQVCCQVWGVTFSRMLAPGKERAVARPRQAAFKILRDRGGVSFPEIARYFGRDHSTVVHGYRKAAELIAGNTEFRENYEHVCALLDEAAVSE